MDNRYVEDNLIYIPEPTRPANFDKEFAEIVGVVPGSNIPCARVVWGMDHRTFFAGEMEIHYIDPNGVYVGAPYYIFEGWTAPEVYNRAEWEASRYCDGLDVLGAYPENGVWDFVCFVRNDDLSFAPLDRALQIAREWRYNHEHPAKTLEHYMAFRAQNELRRRAAANEAKERMRDEIEHFMKQALPAAGAQIEVPGTFTKKELATLPAKRKVAEHLLGGANVLPQDALTTTPSGLIVKKSAIVGN